MSLPSNDKKSLSGEDGDLPNLEDDASDEMADFIDDDNMHGDEEEEYVDIEDDEEDEEDEEDDDDDDDNEDDEDVEDDNGDENTPAVEPPIDDGIDTSNIISGKRVRRGVMRYEDEVFSSKEYQQMMLCDVPPDELKAALVDEDFSEEEDSVEDAYEVDGEGDEDEEDEDEEEVQESEKLSSTQGVQTSDIHRSTSAAGRESKSIESKTKSVANVIKPPSKTEKVSSEKKVTKEESKSIESTKAKGVESLVKPPSKTEKDRSEQKVTKENVTKDSKSNTKSATVLDKTKSRDIPIEKATSEKSTESKKTLKAKTSEVPFRDLPPEKSRKRSGDTPTNGAAKAIKV